MNVCAHRKGDFDDFGHGRFEDFFDRFGDSFHFRSHHGHDDDMVPTELNAALDPSATDGHGHMLVGTDIPASGFEVQHNAAEGIEIAMNGMYRTGNNIGVTSVDKHGVLEVDVPSGMQVVDHAHGVSSANANRAAWNFNYSIDALGSKDLSDYNIHLLVDTDASSKANYLDLVLAKAPAGNPTGSHSGYVFETADTHQIVIGDSGGVLNHVDQNSFNFKFIQSLLDSNPHVPGVQPYNFEAGATFDVQLVVGENDPHGHIAAAHDYVKSAAEAMHGQDIVADLHMQFHVVDHAALV